MADEYCEVINQFLRITNRWCVQDQFGFSFISGVPPTPEATERLVERIGFIRETQCKRPVSDKVTF